MTDFDAIPAALRERDQWHYWNASNETPRAPLESPAASSPASWSDPASWLSFDEVCEGADMVAQAGIGYVTAADNPDHAHGLYGVIDLDGVVDEDGYGVKDWVPSLQPFIDRDAYIEYSPSGEGLHIPVVGIDVPEWWADEHFSDGAHEGVEVLTNKFATFTGDPIDASGDTVVEHGEWLVDWLREAYKQLYGEAPEHDRAGGDSGDWEGDDWLDEERARGALDCIPPDVAYPTWRDIGMALANHFGTSAGQRLFEQWSRGGSKWDREAERQAGRIVRDASNYQFDAGTLVYHAEAHGWDASAAASAAMRERDGSPTTAAETDGGAAAAAGGGGEVPDPPEAREWALSPHSILELAARDGLHPLDYDDEGGYDGTLRDIRVAERANYVWQLATKTGDDGILAQHKGPIYAYDDGVWRDDDKERLRQIAGQALDIGFSKSVVNELEAQVRKDRMMRPDELGAPDATIMCENGLLDLLRRDLEPAQPDHYALAKIPTAYDPDAECPRWEAFVEESIDTEAERQKFQEYAGYCLWRHSQDYGKALFLVGPTDSGKGTALKALKQVLGRNNVAAESLHDLIQTRWGTAQLYGNIANMRNEVTPSGLGEVQKFKELTGGEDEVSAEFKGQDKFQFVVTQKFLFSTNEVPSIQNADEAFYNRLLFVRFPNTVPPEDQDKQLLEKLAEERSGILNWMLEGLGRLLKQGQFTGERSTNGKKEICDAFGGVLDRFTYNCLMVTGDEDDVVSKSDLHDLAHAYADDIDKEPEWGKQTGFSRELSNERGIGQGQRRIDGGNTKVFTGVRVKPEVVYRYDMDIRARTADTDDGSVDNTRLQSYQDDDVRPGYDSAEERNVPPLVVKAVMDHDGDLPHDELVATLADQGVSEADAERAIEKCLRRGDISDPANGEYRA